MTADQGEARFFLWANNLEGQARSLADFLDEIGAVLCLAAGFGRDTAHMPNALCLQLFRDGTKRIEGPVHCNVR